VAQRILEKNPAATPSIDEILKASGISKGSLYHHFKDGQDLIDEALLTGYAFGVDDNIAQIKSALSQARGKAKRRRH